MTTHMPPSATVLTFPGAIPRASGADRSAEIALRIAANLGNENVTDCADALLRNLASMCTVNAINETEAIELAQLMALDLETLVRAMLLPEGAPLGVSPVAESLAIVRRFADPPFEPCARCGSKAACDLLGCAQRDQGAAQ